MNATVSIPLSELQEIQNAQARAEAETAKVREQLAAALLGSPDGRVASATAFARDCLTLARFAVANCPPETIVGWPFDVLRRVADGLAVLPDYSLMDRDMAIDLMAFAKECEDHERRRQQVKAGIVAPPRGTTENASGGPVAYATTTLGGEPTPS